MTESEKLDLVISKLNNLEEKFDDLKSEVQDLKNRTVTIESTVTDIKFITENEIRVIIWRIPEWHFDLSKKLNECIRLSNDIKDKQEIQDIYINMHNNKLRTLMHNYLDVF